MSLVDVRNAFQVLFNDSQVEAITENAYAYDFIEDSNLDNRKYRFNNEVNFFIFLVTKSIQAKLSGCEQEIYNVEIKYYLEDNKNGTSANTIRDAFETVHSRIKTVIGSNWDESVDYYLPVENPITMSLVTVGDRPAWLGVFSYQGYKQILN